jgi:DNA-binding response OmpR family regulator
MLTARGDQIYRIVGLETGADDRHLKPFEPRELVARL